MTPILEKFSIVLAGAFNPAILSPQWLAKNAFQYAEDRQFQVEILAPVAGFGGTPRLSFDNVSYTPTFNSLTFHVGEQTAEAREAVCAGMGHLLAQLPHTPVGGLGFNFAFKVANPNDDLLTLLQVHEGMNAALGEGSAVVVRAWKNTISLADALLNIECQLEGNEVTLDANFHHDVNSATAAAAILNRVGAFEHHFGLVKRAVTALTGEQLEEQ